MGVEEHLALPLVEIDFALGAGGFFNTVGVVQQHPEIANTSDAGFRADGGLSGLDARVAEDALLRFAALPVEVDFFVRTAADAQTPAAAFILVDQHDAVFFTLVDGAARAGGDAARIQAVLAQARQIHHEGVFKLAVHLLLNLIEVTVAGALFKFAAEQLFPVGPPNDFIHPFTVDKRARAGGRQMFALRRVVQMLVIKGKRLIVVVNLRYHRIGEDLGDDAHFAAQTRAYFAINVAHPAAFPYLLVFPVFRITDARFGFDVVKPGVFHPFASGPDVFTGDGTGVAADAFIKIENHADL